MIDDVAAEALSDWLDYCREYVPVEGVDFDRDEPGTRPVTPDPVWGSAPEPDDSPLPF